MFSEIANTDVDGEKNFLVLPLDVTKFDTHVKAVETALTHFNQVQTTMYVIIFNLINFNATKFQAWRVLSLFLTNVSYINEYSDVLI